MPCRLSLGEVTRRHAIRVIRQVAANHAEWTTTALPGRQHAEPMFEQVVVGICDDQAGRDAIALAARLLSADGAVTLPQCRSSAPGPGLTPAPSARPPSTAMRSSG